MSGSDTSKSFSNRYPKGYGCISAFVMYIILMGLGKLLLNAEEEIVLICLGIAFFWGYYVYKRRSKKVKKNDTNVMKPNRRFSLKKLIIIFIVFFFIGLGLVVLYEELNTDKRDDNIAEYTLTEEERREKNWYDRIYAIEGEIGKLNQKYDDLLEFQNTTFGALSSYWDDTDEKQHAIVEKIRILQKQLPKDPIGTATLSRHGVYLYARKQPNFNSEQILKVYSNDELDIIYKSVNQNVIDIIKENIPYFDGNFKNAEEEAYTIWLNKSDANAYIKNKKKRKQQQQELAKNTKIMSDLLKKFKSQYKEDWWLVRVNYQEAYIHDIQIKELDK